MLEDRPIGIQELRATGFATLRTVETGSWLGRAFQGKGIGTEMRAAVLALAFDGLGAEVATSGAIDGNAASRRVSEKLGYEPNGESRVAPRGTFPSSSIAIGCGVSDGIGIDIRSRIEHLDECLGMFGLDAPAGTEDRG